ncbi:uracil-DNA glycosylase [Cognatiyoonia sp. IB215446]|uniref:uracil-DNA glycosylase n=1 Tax=Cognatiyoonia sp. IB215446 TaxID=3097355 RepID=UPI002A0E85A4|nr:uracil-DNA glycosylase [Cognatiyoonia sp. IB215446]MDX8348740.1 uracil-DNA glycosylase [Cognatiyoonia sp. IB215446]
MFDLSRLGAWGDLPFFSDDLPAIAERVGTDILPPPKLTFRALELCQPEQTKVVIIGQDPYHTPGKADGLAFSIPTDFGGRLDSLGNIFREIADDIAVERGETDLTDWADQGVLLLNTALTVPPGRPKAHAKIGWTKLVNQVLDHLNAAPRAFLLWGGPAGTFAKPLAAHHLIHTSAHPSPLSVHRGFFGSRPFSKVNQWLIDRDQEPIHWADP